MPFLYFDCLCEALPDLWGVLVLDYVHGAVDRNLSWKSKIPAYCSIDRKP